MEAHYDLFTKIYLDTHREKSSVVETVSMIVQGSATGKAIVIERDIF